MERDLEDQSSTYSRASRTGAERNLNKRAMNTEDEESQGIAWGSKVGGVRESAVPKISSTDEYDSYGSRRGGVAADKTTAHSSVANNNKVKQMKSNEVSSILQWSEEPSKL